MIRAWCLILMIVINAHLAHAQSQTERFQFQPFNAEYIAYVWGSPQGTASMELDFLDNQVYSLLYQSHVSKFFLSDKRVEHSIFTLEGSRLVAKEYHYTRSGTGKDKSLSVEFHPENSQISIDNGKKSFDLPWEGEIDNQLYRLQISDKLATGEREFDIPFINYRGEKKQYHFVVEGQERLVLPFGELNTIKVTIKRNNSARETYAWYAATLNYQLVRLQQFKDGKEQGDIKLSKFTFTSDK
jgi:hypothetical protein